MDLEKSELRRRRIFPFEQIRQVGKRTPAQRVEAPKCEALECRKTRERGEEGFREGWRDHRTAGFIRFGAAFLEFVSAVSDDQIL